MITAHPNHTSQDTNAVQYELMRCIAAASRCVTVVGDPDQSSTFWLLILPDLDLIHNYIVYGWRSADITNLGKMRNGKIEETHTAMH